VPGWVEALSRITRVEGLDVHVAHQKFPVFLLGEPASRRSAVLSIGQEAAYVRDMLQIHRERCTRDTTLVRTGERELAEISEKLEPLEQLGEIAARLAAARELASGVRAEDVRRRRLADHIARFSKIGSGLARIRNRRRTLERLPSAEELDVLRNETQRAQDLARVAQRVLMLHRTATRLDARRGLLAALPGSLPALEDTTPTARAASRLGALSNALTEARRRVQKVQAEMRSSVAAIDTFVIAEGGLCPTCGSPVTADDLLRDRHHGHGEKAA
jgi:hypothetical protein